MTEYYCELVKQKLADAENFEDFLKHVGECPDCLRRIQSQIITDFKQRQMGAQ